MRPGAVLVFCFLVSHLGAAEKTAVPRQATDSAEFAAYRTASEAIAVPDFTTRLPGFVRGWDAPTATVLQARVPPRRNPD